MGTPKRTRVNVLLDPEVDGELYAVIVGVTGRKKATLLRNLAKEGLMQRPLDGVSSLNSIKPQMKTEHKDGNTQHPLVDSTGSSNVFGNMKLGIMG